MSFKRNNAAVARTGQGRFTQLDGLRGIAAVIVLVHHLMLTSPTFASPYQDRTANVSDLASWVIFSPLHLFWNGNAAVYVFFVLSGFVLILPFTQHTKAFSWRSYYPKRLLRLYLPVWASVVVAVALMILIPRSTSPDNSWWVNAHNFHPTMSGVMKDSFLLAGTGLINGPLWSLRWEVAFSLLLPFYVTLGLLWRHLWPIKLMMLIAMTAAGAAAGNDWLFFLPIFGLGVILGFEREHLVKSAASIPALAWASLSIVAVLLLNSTWNLQHALPGSGVMAALGGFLLVSVFIVWRPAAALGNFRIAQWLGRISFSLYLIHVPVIITVATAFGSQNWVAVIVISALLSFALAELFYRFIEKPSRLLANHVGTRFDPAALRAQTAK